MAESFSSNFHSSAVHPAKRWHCTYSVRTRTFATHFCSEDLGRLLDVAQVWTTVANPSCLMVSSEPDRGARLPERPSLPALLLVLLPPQRITQNYQKRTSAASQDRPLSHVFTREITFTPRAFQEQNACLTAEPACKPSGSIAVLSSPGLAPSGNTSTPSFERCPMKGSESLMDLLSHKDTGMMPKIVFRKTQR
jgi:hypothetical protein